MVKMNSKLMFSTFTPACSALSTCCLYHSGNFCFINFLQLPFTVKSIGWNRCFTLLGTLTKYILFCVKCEVTSSVIWQWNKSKTSKAAWLGFPKIWCWASTYRIIIWTMIFIDSNVLLECLGFRLRENVSGNLNCQGFDLQSPIQAFFYKQHFFSTQPQCCLTFLWIELQVLLWCCLIHISIIILRHFLYLLCLCPCLYLGLVMSYLCDSFFIFIFIFIMINCIISWIQTHLFFCLFF